MTPLSSMVTIRFKSTIQNPETVVTLHISMKKTSILNIASLHFHPFSTVKLQICHLPAAGSTAAMTTPRTM